MNVIVEEKKRLKDNGQLRGEGFRKETPIT
jgi:hypothetical protein